MAVPLALGLCVCALFIPVQLIDVEPDQIPDAIREESLVYKNWVQSRTTEEFRAIEATRIRSYMNTTIDPCDNFYLYSCGNWPNAGSILRRTGFVDEQGLQLLTKSHLMEALIESDVRETDGPDEVQVKKFYQKCLTARWDDGKSVKDLIGSFNSTFVYQEGQFNWTNTEFQAHSYGFDLFFKVDVTLTPGGGEEPVLQLEPIRRDTLANTENFKVYREMMTTTHKEIGLGDVNRMVLKLFEFEKKLAEILKDEEQKQASITIESLQERVPQVDWLQFFSLFKVGETSQTDHILINPEAVKKIVEHITSSNPKALENFMMWRLTYLATNHFKSVVETVDLREECLGLVKTLMRPAVIAMYAKQYFSETSKQQVELLARSVLEQLGAQANTSTWLDERTKMSFWENLRSTRMYIGYSDYVEDEMYADVDLAKGHLFEDIIELERTNFLRKLLLFEREYRAIYDSLFDPMSESSGYLKGSKGKLFVPLNDVQPPMYHQHSPNFINYGLLGRVIGHALMQAFNVSTITHKDDYRKRLACFESHVRGTKDDLQEIILIHESIKASLLAYRSSNKAQHESLQGSSPPPLTKEQGFFVAFAQFYCGAIDVEVSFDGDETGRQTSGVSRVLGTVSNSKEFAEAFNCPPEVPMNPKEKCQFF